MAENSNIEWTDHTFNPWIGCQKWSDGCKFCYADTLMTRKPRWANTWGPPATSERIRTSEANWQKPLKWNKEAERLGLRYKVFCASLADVFEGAPQVEPWRIDLFRLIFETPNLDWLILTKRPENVIPFMDWACWPETGCALFGPDDDLPPNVWIGTSIENQEQAEKRIPALVEIPAYIHFLSIEPLLGEINIEQYLKCSIVPGPEIDWKLGTILPDPPPPKPRGARLINNIDWVIVGGESGPNARPMHPYWATSIRDQCQVARIPFFFKQWGAWVPVEESDLDLWGCYAAPCEAVTVEGTSRCGYYCDPEADLHPDHRQQLMKRVGKKAAGRLLEGQEWNEYPEIV